MSEPSAEALVKNLQQFYNSLAPIYDLKYGNPSIDYMRRAEWSVICRHTERRRMRLLDLGCGTGSLAVKLASKGHEVVGVDISPDMIAIAQRKAKDAGVESRTQFLVGSIEDLLGLSGAFDFAYSTFGALNHVMNLKEALRGIGHILSSGRWFFFSLANRLNTRDSGGESHDGGAVWKKLEMKELGKAVWTRFYARNEVESALRESGFCLTNVGGVLYLVRPSYVHSDTMSFSAKQSLMARAESMIRWRGPANRRAAYLLFIARKTALDE